MLLPLLLILLSIICLVSSSAIYYFITRFEQQTSQSIDKLFDKNTPISVVIVLLFFNIFNSIFSHQEDEHHG